MRVAVVTGPGLVELRDESSPTHGSEEVVVEVAACGLCTMERRLFTGEKRVYPVAPGHEVSGRVVAVGDEVASLPGVAQLGELVTVDLLTRCGACSSCRRGRSALCQRPQGGALSDGTVSMGAGLSQLVKVHAKQAWAVGDAPEDHAAMGEPLACVAHSVRLSRFQAGDRVAVIGAGFMGRLHLALTRHGGGARVGMVDVSDGRLADASTAGATWVAAPDDAVGVGGPQDVVFVTAGAPGSLELALSLCDDGGTVVVYGAFPRELTVPIAPDAIHHHELSVIGVYSQEPEDWRTSAGLIQSGALAGDMAGLVTARFPLTDVAEAFRLVSTSPTYRVLVGR